MGVYNSELYLKEAIDSILSQSFKDFKFVIINDGSTDDSEQIILSYNDVRIIYLKNSENIGIGRTVRKGMEMIHSKYVIRVDSDDISYPERFATQIDFMDRHPEIAVAGTHFDVIWGEYRSSELTETPLEIRTRALFECPIIQPSIIINNDFLRKHNLNYDFRFEVAGDYGLFMDTLMFGDLAIIPKKLMAYRKHKGQLSSTKYTLQDENSTTKRIEILSKLGGAIFNKRERTLYMQYSFHRKLEKTSDFLEIKILLKKIRNIYFKQNLYLLDKKYYLKLEYERLEILFIENKIHGFSLLREYLVLYGFDFRIFLFLGLSLRVLKYTFLHGKAKSG